MRYEVLHDPAVKRDHPAPDLCTTDLKPEYSVWTRGFGVWSEYGGSTDYGRYRERLN